MCICAVDVHTVYHLHQEEHQTLKAKSTPQESLPEGLPDGEKSLGWFKGMLSTFSCPEHAGPSRKCLKDACCG